MQYQDRGIPEYWIVDPQRSTILVLVLTGDRYCDWRTLQANDAVESAQFGLLNCIADQIFAAAQ